MKKVLMIALAAMTFQVVATQPVKKERIEIKALKAVELTYDEFGEYDVKLVNTSGKQINVSVFGPDNKKKMMGFGLGPMGNAVVKVKEGQILRLKNTSAKDISVSLRFVEPEEVKPVLPSAPRIQFTLHNSSAKSIPLIIPNVMNPNLSPFSNSGVSLAVGQKIYYKKGISKVLLLTVDESIQQGDKIDIAEMVRDLKKD